MYLEAKVQHKVCMSSFIFVVEDITTWSWPAQSRFSTGPSVSTAQWTSSVYFLTPDVLMFTDTDSHFPQCLFTTHSTGFFALQPLYMVTFAMQKELCFTRSSVMGVGKKHNYQGSLRKAVLNMQPRVWVAGANPYLKSKPNSMVTED